MMKKENYIKIVVIIIIFFNLFIICRYFNIQNYCNKVKLECAEKEQNYLYNFQRDLELMSQRIYIEKDSILNKKISLTPKLIFVYSGNECEKCIFENIEKIKKIIGEGIESNLIILPIVKESRNIRIAPEDNLNGLIYKAGSRISSNSKI
jgi:hypothetical protein